jgi:methyltransferase
MSSQLLFTLIIALTAIERLIELYVSKRNAKWSFAHGGREVGQSHYIYMVILHTGFLFACAAEVHFLARPFTPETGYALIVAAVLLQGLRWWCITTLGFRWNTRVIIVPGLPRVTGGPYRWFSHPNYVAVVLEGIVLPLIHNAWLTAIAFTVLNAILLKVRIGIENQALDDMEGSVANAA